MLNVCVCCSVHVCVHLSHSHTYPLILITVLLDIIKITPLLSILPSFMTFPGGKKPQTCNLLLSLLFLPFSLRLFPFLESLSLLPTSTQDNHPKARFSIKSVTQFHSQRAIHSIMHTNHFNTKLFFNSPVRKITAQRGTNTHTYSTV